MYDNRPATGYRLAVALLAVAGNLIGAACEDFRYFEVPTFAKEVENATVPVGREAVLSCVIYNLGNYKVAWVRVDTQTILTIDDTVITRSQRFTVRHMTDASGDYRAPGRQPTPPPTPAGHQQQHQHHHHHHHQHGVNGSSAANPGTGRAAMHKTWQLIIRDVQSSDAGLYMCQLNTEPMTSQTGYLSVTVPPDIVDSESSGDVMVTEGQNTTLRCSATGHPLPKITWRREDGRPIHNHALTVEGSVLHLARIPRQNIGAYLCIAANGVPPSVSKRFMLRVQFPPTVTAKNQLVGARHGDVNVTLECHCESFPKPVVYWLKHGTQDVVVSGGKYREEKRETNHYEVTMQLTFLHLEREDFMAYQCVCRNTLGLAESVVRLYQITQLPEESDANEVYAEPGEQQDGRRDQLITWNSKAREEPSRRLSNNKHTIEKTRQLAVGTGRSQDVRSSARLLIVALCLVGSVSLISR